MLITYSISTLNSHYNVISTLLNKVSELLMFFTKLVKQFLLCIRV